MEFYMRTLSALHLHPSQDTQKKTHSDRASNKNYLEIREKRNRDGSVE